MSISNPDKLIFLAEDDIDDRMLFEEVFIDFEDKGYRLESFENGQHLLDALNGSDTMPFVIVLDQNMPVMSGKETLLKIRSEKKFSHLPVIIYSTYLNEKLKEDFISIGASSVNIKPDTMDGFRKMIRGFIE